ncbi:hypothetical protein MNAN1_002151 [Malassezia nana]|uniref:Nucleoporin pom152 n=1 Tax=Malassezia nana TaxID=180528 RepID=A0AAF0EMF0_9BASI|nr:hypothetical protein MNAN1_002151 [Malassezia nana]
MSARPPEARPGREPRIPLAVMDAPSQRFYAAALFVAVQAWKWTHIVRVCVLRRPAAFARWASWLDPTHVGTALLIDFALCYLLYWLAIPPRAVRTSPATRAPPPRRRFSMRGGWISVWLVLAVLDLVTLARHDTWLVLQALAPGPAAWSVGERRVRLQQVVQPATHIAGQHTVHLVPPGTARLAPDTLCLCVGGNIPEAHIPVLFHDTKPAELTYSVTDVHGARTERTVSHPATSVRAHAVPRTSEPDVPRGARALSLAERKRARRAARPAEHPVEMVHDLRVAHTGTVRLEAVVDEHGRQARILAHQVRVVECPRAALVHSTVDYCPGDAGHLEVTMHGTPPLTLEYVWSRGVRTSPHTLSHMAANEPAFLSLDLAEPGAQTLQLVQVTDTCGNAASINDTVQVRVHEQAHVHFDPAQCRPGRPLPLLRNGPPRHVRFLVEPRGAQDVWDVRVRYTPDVKAALPRPLTAADAWNQTLRVAAGEHTLPVAQPGTYTIEHVSSSFCPGQISAPWTCDVVDVPLPRAEIHFESIEDPCAGTVGVKALSTLEGEPPFRLHYEMQRPGHAATRHVRVVEAQTRDELEFWPSTEGPVTYRFLALDDAHYRGVPLDGPSFTQLVHPLASAAFVAAQDKVVRSCGQAQVTADVELSGTGPFDLTYSVRGARGAPVEHEVRGLSGPLVALDLALPPEELRQQGRATVSLLRLRDGKGCERRLATRDLRVDVRRASAAVGFTQTHVVQHEHEPVAVALRLEGTAPWHITYQYTRDEGPVEQGSATLHDANEALLLTEPGRYTLTSVRDAHCMGTVLPEATAEVVMRPRPRAYLAGEMRANGSVLAPAVCQGTRATATLQLVGEPPIEVAYVHRLPAEGPTRVRRHTLSTAQESAEIELDDRVPGWHTYEVVEVGDAYYARGRAARAMLEHYVHVRPRGAFTSTQVVTACVGDDSVAWPSLQLHGTPPFHVTVQLRPRQTQGAGNVSDVVLVTHTHTLTVPPALAPRQPGAWELVVTRIEDAHCVEAAPDAVLRLEMIESAGVLPTTARSDYCVGERIDFVLQGTSPWTVEYSFNGRVSHVVSRTAELVRVADRPGRLQVLGAGHSSNACRHTHAPLEATIHALPRAHVSAGAHRIEALHEGGQAEIVFTLQGEPPFAFTYQRTEAVDKHALPKVLETHTVDHWTDTRYVVRTSQEGTWSVIWMQDRWCQVSLGEVSGPAAWDAQSSDKIP